MIVVYAMTRNIYQCLLPSLTSLLEHNSPETIYIMAEDDKLPYDLPDICRVVNVSQQSYFIPESPNIGSIFTYMAMMRACYTELFPEVDKVIQLDIDTIICDSLQPLWDIDLTGKWFAACPEYLGQYDPWDRGIYYNIGVCVFNLEQMRKDSAAEQMVRMLNTRRMMCVEQDALNFFAVPGKAVSIPLRYNECFCCGSTDDPAVVHYAGYRDWYTNPYVPRREYLMRYLNGERVRR